MRYFNICFRSWLCVAAIAIVLSGCSALRLGYSNGESIAAYWIDGYVDFTAEQQSWGKERLNGLFAWHRQTQLPDYVLLLASYRDRLSQPVAAGDILEDYEAIKVRLLRIADKAAPDAAALALTLQPEQLVNLQEKFASNNEKFRREFLSGDREEQQAARYKKVLKQVEYWFGNLSREQKAQVRAASDARPLDNELWLAERRHRQQALIALLKRVQVERPPAEEVERMLKDYIRTVIHANGDPQRATVIAESRRATAAMVAAIISLTTAEQKQHASEQIQNWIDDFRKLSAAAQ